MLNAKKIFIYVLSSTLIILIIIIGVINMKKQFVTASTENFIKYVEFKPPYQALEKALKADIQSQSSEIKINWIEILAYLAAKNSGDFSKYKNKDIDDIINEINSGKSMEEISSKLKLYPYYLKAYTAVLNEFVGIHTINNKEEYGLKVFSPIAKTFPFDHYSDFGASRTYGYSRPHLGHDLMAATGTPVVAIESGIVEIMGWNQYGGWRIGIRSFDKQRYYYYAHLRKDKPFQEDLYENKIVKAGDVIGYVGRTGYSSNENVNNITSSHLHVGLELIFDESQKESNNEIWIDLYNITKLLMKNQSEVYRNSENKQYYRKYDFNEPLLSNAS